MQMKIPLLHGIEEYDAYSDHPIDWTYKILDKLYPKSLFIFTERRDREAWIRSKHILATASRTPHRPIQWAESYDNHFKDVKEYFKNRPKDILFIDICDGEGWEKLCPFLEVDVPKEPFPHAGKSKDTPMEKFCKDQGFIKE
jgi:hypothetical protein